MFMNVIKLVAFVPAPSLPYLRPTSTATSSTVLVFNNTRRRLCTSCAVTAISTTAPILDGLPNARDLSSADPSLVRSGRIFRGATPATISDKKPNADIVHFLRSADVLLDLRSNDERRYDDRVALTWACGRANFENREYHISLLNKRRVVFGLARVLPRQQLRNLLSQVASNPLAARTDVTKRIDQGGLVLLNRILVEAGANSIGRVMNTITDGLQYYDNSRVYFYCSAGKDRTGLIAALILKVLGVGEREIIFDYSRSSETWENGPFQLRADYRARLEHAGLTPSQWMGSEPEVMEQTLKYIKQRFGSIEDYLTWCGFGKERMQQLQKAMRPDG